MAKRKRVEKPITVTTVIEEAQHEALRAIAYHEHMPMANLVRKALDEFIKKQMEKRDQPDQKKPQAPPAAS